jgi:hypothetical protein
MQFAFVEHSESQIADLFGDSRKDAPEGTPTIIFLTIIRKLH